MKAAIIAAGKGERLSRGGITVPKPLITVGGKPLIHRAIHAAAKTAVTSIACIVNDLNPDVAGYLRSGSWPVPLELVVKTTPNSMESLFGLAPILNSEPFLMLTVDAVFAFETLETFLTQAKSIQNAQAVLAVTRFVDDEKPLWVRLDDSCRIIALGDAAVPTPYVTAGFYYFTPDIFTEIEVARSNNLNALRQFLNLLMDKAYSLHGVEVSKTIDVDYPEDVKIAQAYVRKIEGHG